MNLEVNSPKINSFFTKRKSSFQVKKLQIETLKSFQREEMIISNGLQTINHPGIAFYKRNSTPKTADGNKNTFRMRKTT